MRGRRGPVVLRDTRQEDSLSIHNWQTARTGVCPPRVLPVCTRAPVTEEYARPPESAAGQKQKSQPRHPVPPLGGPQSGAGPPCQSTIPRWGKAWTRALLRQPDRLGLPDPPRLPHAWLDIRPPPAKLDICDPPDRLDILTLSSHSRVQSPLHAILWGVRTRTYHAHLSHNY